MRCGNTENKARSLRIEIPSCMGAEISGANTGKRSSGICKRRIRTNSARIRISYRHDGSDGRPRARVYRGAASLRSGRGGADYEEYIGEGGIQEVPENTQGHVVWEVMGGRILCQGVR